MAEQSQIKKMPTVAISGELDHHTAEKIRTRMDKLIVEKKLKCVVLDLRGLTFMDSSGIGLIMGRYRLLRSLGGELTLTGVSPRLESVIRLAGMDKLPVWGKNERSENHETCQ